MPPAVEGIVGIDEENGEKYSEQTQRVHLSHRLRAAFCSNSTIDGKVTHNKRHQKDVFQTFDE
jgi:hypothetical protein